MVRQTSEIASIYEIRTESTLLLEISSSIVFTARSARTG